jgi:hypothetical protein
MEKPTLGETLIGAYRQVSDLFSTTFAVAKARLEGSGSRIGFGIALLAAALAFVLGVVPLVTLALVWGLVALGLPAWAAYLIVAALGLLIAVGLFFWGKALLKRAASLVGQTATLVKDSLAALGGTPDPQEGSDSDQDAPPGSAAPPAAPPPAPSAPPAAPSAAG